MSEHLLPPKCEGLPTPLPPLSCAQQHDPKNKLAGREAATPRSYRLLVRSEEAKLKIKSKSGLSRLLRTCLWDSELYDAMKYNKSSLWCSVSRHRNC